MKHLITPCITLCALAFSPLAPLPALADDAKPPLNLGDLAPLADSLRDMMEGLTEDILPLMEEFADKIPDLHAYEAPEMLPNGDIIIRRKAKEPKETPKSEPSPHAEPRANPDGSIDL